MYSQSLPRRATCAVTDRREGIFVKRRKEKRKERCGRPLTYGRRDVISLLHDVAARIVQGVEASVVGLMRREVVGCVDGISCTKSWYDGIFRIPY